MSFGETTVAEEFLQLKDAAYVSETSLGGGVSFIKALTKDKMGTVLTEQSVYVVCASYEQSFQARITADKIGWSDPVDVIVRVTRQRLEEAGITLNSLKQYAEMKVDGRRYRVNNIAKMQQFQDDFVYYVVGGKSSASL